MRNTHQRGIAIGPILFVVAILAVLASAIAAGSGSFNGDTSVVKAKAQATAILEYAHEVKFAVDRVLGKGCTDTEISFENPVVGGYINPNSPSDKSCHVFDVNGGGIVWKGPPAQIDLSSVPLGYRNYIFSGDSNHLGPYIPGTTSTDLVIKLSGLSSNICNEIMNLGGGAGPAVGHVTLDKFTGNYGSWDGRNYQFGCSNLTVPNDGTAGLPLGLHHFHYVLHRR